jgi:hypothetical protein
MNYDMLKCDYLLLFSYIGGKRTLKLPPELGYGSRGAGCRGGKYSFISLNNSYYFVNIIKKIVQYISVENKDHILIVANSVTLG